MRESRWRRVLGMAMVAGSIGAGVAGAGQTEGGVKPPLQGEAAGVMEAQQAGVAEARQAAVSLMPMPAGLRMGTGSLVIDEKFSVAVVGYSEARLDRALGRFFRQLSRETGSAIGRRNVEAGKATLVIRTEHASKAVQEVGEDESYSLEVTATGAQLSAATPLGTMHGLQTLLQLVDVTPGGFAVPVVTIKDQPRFPWRGLMMDCARHFMPMEVLKRNLDGMEAVKMNVFHWHLSENQGFRAESQRFPKLHGRGADGLFYTQAEMRELIEYARDRGIRVVPEFDMPGHNTAWFVGHPELASGKGPYEIERRWGIFDPAMDPTNEKLYRFLDELIGEMARIFPDHFFHIGGDEVNGKEWDANPKIQAFMKEHGIKSNELLQAYFSGRVQKLVTRHGKLVVGWDEVLVPGVPKDIVVQSWRGEAALAKAARDGYRGILSNGYYLDLGWSAARHYAVDPLSGDAASLSADEKLRILGGESCMWSEYVDAENVDSRIWPRNAAIAERLWSAQSVTDVASMYRRMEAESQRLEWLGLTHRSYYRLMLQRIAGASAAPEELEALKTLADVVEPVKDYDRQKVAAVEATSLMPLNRLVDAVPLESNAARRFDELVRRFTAGKCQEVSLKAELRAEFTAWKDNDSLFQALASRSELAREAADLSRQLAALGQVGLRALDVSPTSVDDGMTQMQTRSVKDAQQPRAQLLLVPAASVQMLVDSVDRLGACHPEPLE